MIIDRWNHLSKVLLFFDNHGSLYAPAIGQMKTILSKRDMFIVCADVTVLVFINHLELMKVYSSINWIVSRDRNIASIWQQR